MKITDLDKRVLKVGYTQGIHRGAKPFYERMKLKRSTADYILDKMKREKLYSRTSYEVNLPSLGINKFAWVFVSVNWVSFDEDKFINKALSFPEITSVIKITGEYDYGLFVIGENIPKLNEFIMALEQVFQDEIESINILFANREYKRHYIKVVETATHYPKKVDCIVLDEKLKDPSISLIEISKKYKIHRNTISNRWRTIWKNKVLLKEHLELSEEGYHAIGLGLKLFMIIKPVPGKEERLITHFLMLEDVENIFTTLSNEIVLTLRVSDSPHLDSFHTKMISGIEGSLKNSKTILVMGGKKKSHLPIDSLKQVNSNVCEGCLDD